MGLSENDGSDLSEAIQQETIKMRLSNLLLAEDLEERAVSKKNQAEMMAKSISQIVEMVAELKTPSKKTPDVKAIRYGEASLEWQKMRLRHAAELAVKRGEDPQEAIDAVYESLKRVPWE